MIFMTKKWSNSKKGSKSKKGSDLLYAILQSPFLAVDI